MSDTLPSISRIRALLSHYDPRVRGWAVFWASDHLSDPEWLDATLRHLRDETDDFGSLAGGLEGLEWTPFVRARVQLALDDDTLRPDVRMVLWVLWAHHEDAAPRGELPDHEGNGVLAFELDSLPRGIRRFHEAHGIDDLPDRAAAPRDGELEDLLREVIGIADDEQAYIAFDLLSGTMRAHDEAPDEDDALARADLTVLGDQAVQTAGILRSLEGGEPWLRRIQQAAQEREALSNASVEAMLERAAHPGATWLDDILAERLRDAPDARDLLAPPIGRDHPDDRGLPSRFVIEWIGSSQPEVAADWLVAYAESHSETLWFGHLQDAPPLVRVLVGRLGHTIDIDGPLGRETMRALGGIREGWAADVLCDNLLDWSRRLEDDRGMWRVAELLADSRIPELCEDPGLAASLDAARVRAVVSWIWGREIPEQAELMADRWDLDDLWEPQSTVRIRCHACDAWATVDWTGSLLVPCPWCGRPGPHSLSEASEEAVGRDDTAHERAVELAGLEAVAQEDDTAEAWMALVDARAAYDLPGGQALDRLLELEPDSVDGNCFRMLEAFDDPAMVDHARVVVRNGVGQRWAFRQAVRWATFVRPDLGLHLRWREGSKTRDGVVNLDAFPHFDIMMFYDHLHVSLDDDLVAAELVDEHGDSRWFERWLAARSDDGVPSKARKQKQKKKKRKRGRRSKR